MTGNKAERDMGIDMLQKATAALQLQQSKFTYFWSEVMR